MAQGGAVLEIDRGDPPDLGQLLRKRPPAPDSRPVAQRPHRRDATLLERSRRPALDRFFGRTEPPLGLSFASGAKQSRAAERSSGRDWLVHGAPRNDSQDGWAALATAGNVERYQKMQSASCVLAD